MNEHWSSKVCRRLIYAILFIVPLLVFHKEYGLSPTEQSVWVGVESVSDFFFYYKQKVLLLGVGLLLPFFLFHIRTAGLKKSWVYVPIGVLAVMTFLSTLFSEQQHIALNGVFYQLEGLYVQLSYLILTITAFNVLDLNQHRKQIGRALVVPATIGAVIAIFQAVDIDLSILVWRIVSHSQAAIEVANVGVYGTVSNPNYLGVWMAVALPAIGLLIPPNPTIKQLSFRIAQALIIITALILSKSDSAMLVAGFLLLFSFGLFWKKRGILSPQVIVAGIVVLALCTYMAGHISRHFESTNQLAIESIVLNDHQATVQTNYDDFSLDVSDGALHIYDSTKSELPLQVDQNSGQIKMENQTLSWLDMKVEISGNVPIIHLRHDKRLMRFPIENGVFKYMDGANRIYDQLPNYEIIEARDYGRLGSGRGYIYERLWSEVSKYWLMGAGPDNFPFVFPQDDLIGKFNAFGYDNLVVERPHSGYLQVLINSGGMALLALLALLIGGLKQAIKTDQIGMGLIILAVGLMLVVNDSIIGISPIIWVVLGVSATALKNE